MKSDVATMLPGISARLDKEVGGLMEFEVSSSARRRVFVLGSGASAHTGIPTLGDFLLKGLRGLPRDSCRKFRDFLHQMFPALESKSDEPSLVPTVEEVLTLVDVSIELDQGIGDFDTDELRNVRKEAVTFISEAIEATSREVRVPDASRYTRTYEEFAGSLRPGDTVITFNWDLFLDDTILRYSKVPVRNLSLGYPAAILFFELVDAFRIKFNSPVRHRGKLYGWDTVIRLKAQELANYIVGRRAEFDFDKPEPALERTDSQVIRNQILRMTTAEGREFGLRRSTLWYLRQRACGGRSFKTYGKVRVRFSQTSC